MISVANLVLIMCIVIVGMLLGFSIGFYFVLKISREKLIDTEKEKSKISVLLDTLSDFIDNQLIKPVREKTYEKEKDGTNSFFE